MSEPGGSPFQNPASATTPYAQLVFVFQQLLRGVATATIVKVKACTNEGGIVPSGTVDVVPMVNQVDGLGQPVPHDVIYGLPYTRIQGGKNAVIIDPSVGDLGIAVFASRDISSVKAAKAQANPGSARVMDYADGMYIGGLLNAAPENYVVMTDALLKLFHTTKIVLQAPNVEIDASSEFKVDSPDSEFTGNMHTPQTLTADIDVVFGPDETSSVSHEHPTAAPGPPSPPTPGS